MGIHAGNGATPDGAEGGIDDVDESEEVDDDVTRPPLALASTTRESDAITRAASTDDPLGGDHAVGMCPMSTGPGLAGADAPFDS